ncbi:hypothetical protein [Dysgonomonas sp. 520]|uniref:hypothetical protein n=1 Tax=Dysgonomonas sp. 520 TaxID=2302931 RepID=UPI0013D34DC9|nr:hypothetical protein [Dysgonomonas sp. 520]NDW10953.1 hypothetical protein [Dysgonomonas sp. 520]
MNNGILLDEETGDLSINIVRDAQGYIVSGLTVGNNDYQNIQLVVLSNKGDFREQPILGVGVERYLKSVGRANDLRREITVQLEAIGYGKANVTVNNNGKLEIDI